MKNKLTLVALLSASMLLASCGTKQGSSSLLGSSDSSNGSSSNVPVADNGLRLFMYGALYPNQVRSIYASFLTSTTGTLVWESSDEAVVTVSSREEGAMPEGLLLAKSEGKATIRAHLESDPSIQASFEVEVKHGEAMASSLYDSFKGAATFTSHFTYLDYDLNYQEKAADTYDVSISFEENKAPSVEGEENYTDAIEVRSTKNGVTSDAVLVRSAGGKVGTEYITLQNTLSAYDRTFGDDEETMAWDASGLTNPFAHSSVSSSKDFESYDGGKTYHFLGGYNNAAIIANSLTGADFSPDDLWIGVEDGVAKTFGFMVDPASSIAGEKDEKYGLRVEGTLSELGTASVKHLQPFAHEKAHDDLDTAIKEIRSSKNYTVSYDLVLAGEATKKYTYRFTEDTVDAVVTNADGSVSSHTGLHKTDEKSYIKYEMDLSRNVLVQTAEYTNSVWEGIDKNGLNVARYPTFSFAAEILTPEADGSYKARDGYASFIPYVAYLPATLSLDTTYESASIALDKDGHIASISATLTSSGSAGTLTLAYSAYGSTSVSDLDFKNIEKPTSATSWAEESASLYKEMQAWKLPVDNIPYVYSKTGWRESLGWSQSVGSNAAYLESNNFASDSERDAYLAEYEEALRTAGYSALEKKDSNNYEATLWQKGDTKISITASRNWNGALQDSVKLWVYDPSISANS